MNGSIDGFSFKAPWFIRGVLFFLKGRFLRRTWSPGITLPRDNEPMMFPTVSSPQIALEAFRTAVERTKRERMSAPHPAFGALSPEQWMQIHLRHAELHLGFAVPTT